MTGALLVSIHDVAPATLPEARAWLDELDVRGIAATVLVVPGPWRRSTLDQDDATVTWLRVAERRHEIALHGWDHGSCRASGAGRRALGQVLARGADEFIGLDRPQAAARLTAGRRVLVDTELHPEGFTPPGWPASWATVQAAGEIGLRYVTSQTAVIDLRRARRYPVLALSNRPGGWGEGVGADVLRRLAPVLGSRPDAVADAVEDLLAVPAELRVRLARRRAERYSWEATVDGLLSAHEATTDRSRRGRVPA